jgi:hypothetical protein
MAKAKKVVIAGYAKKIKALAPDGIVAYGNAGFSGSFGKGNAPCPTKTILGALASTMKVVMVSEHYTSQVCRCGRKLTPVKHGRHHHCHAITNELMDWVERKPKSCHGVIQCKTVGGCHITWNRDVVGALNIQYLFNYMVLHKSSEARPKEYCFPKEFNRLEPIVELH